MPETYGRPERERSVEEVIREDAEPTIRSVIAGHPQAAVRRIVLYVLTFALLVGPVPALGIIPLALLALTDQLA